MKTIAVTVLFFIIFSLSFAAGLLHPEISAPEKHGRTFKDMSGREVVIDESRKSGAVILPVILSGFATVCRGVSDIMAASGPALKIAENGGLGNVYQDLVRIPLMMTGNGVAPADPESLLLMKPGSLFVWAEQGQLLEKLKIPGLVEIRVDPKNQTLSRAEIWRLIGEVAGKKERAGNLLKKYSAGKSALRRMLMIKNLNRPTVSVLFRVGNGMWLIGDDSYNLADRIKSAGGINAGENLHHMTPVDLEELLAMNPDYIFLNSAPGEDPPEKFFSDIKWNILTSVRKHRVYKLPVYSYMNAVVNEPVEGLLMLEWIAEILHPEQVPHRLRETFRTVYRDTYGYAISDAEIDRIINYKENAISADYSIFTR